MLDLKQGQERVKSGVLINYGDGGMPLKVGKHTVTVVGNIFRESVNEKDGKPHSTFYVRAVTMVDGKKKEFWLPLNKKLVARLEKGESFEGLEVSFEVKFAKGLDLNFVNRASGYTVKVQTVANITADGEED